MLRAAVLIALLALPASAALPVVTLGRIVNPGSTGSMTSALTALRDGRKVFVKSLRGSQRGTRYANLESDVLAHALFTKLGMKCPKAEIVQLAPGSPGREQLGAVVQVMEFVDEAFAGGTTHEGFWPTAELADVPGFAKMGLIDILIGNADRRAPNFFVKVAWVKGEPKNTPIPIDNNAGFGTMIPWFITSDQLNFVKSYDGLGNAPVIGELGSIKNIVRLSPGVRALLGCSWLRKRVLEVEDDVRRTLSDAWWGATVDALPPEMLPADLSIDPRRDIPDGMPLPAGVSRETFFGGLAPNLPHDRLVAARKSELKEVFAWRRDHLRAALEKYWAWRAADPAERKLDAELE